MCVPSLVKIDWEMQDKNPRWPPRNVFFFVISTSDRGDFPRIIVIALFFFFILISNFTIRLRWSGQNCGNWGAGEWGGKCKGGKRRGKWKGGMLTGGIVSSNERMQWQQRDVINVEAAQWRGVGFGSKVGQIASNGINLGLFQIRFKYVLNVLKCDLKNSRICHI